MFILRTIFAFLFLSISFSALSADQRYIAVDTANVRISPNGKVVEKLTRGTSVKVYKTSDTWSRISTDQESPRWISSKLLCSTPNCWMVKSSPSYSSRNSSSSRSLLPTPRSNYGASNSCSCAGGNVCYGPRGGRYCITSGGNKRYGV